MATICFGLIFLFCHCSNAAPLIPREKIPVNIPIGVRKEIERLYSSDPKERVDAARQLGIAGKLAEPAIPYLISMLEDDEDTRMGITHASPDGPVYQGLGVNEMVASILGNSNLGSMATEPLIKALEHKNLRVFFLAANVLQRIKSPEAVEPLVHFLKIGDSQRKEFAIGALINLEPLPVLKVISPLLHESDDSIRIAAARVITNTCVEEGLKELVKLYGDQNSLLRHLAIDALGKMNHPRALEILRKVLRDENINVRRAAARVAGSQNVPETGDLLEFALQDANEDVRKEAVDALANIHTPQAIQILTKAFEDQYYVIRIRAVNSLAKHAGDQALTALLSALQHKHSDVRSTAASFLGSRKDRKAIPPLITLLDDVSDDCREAALFALKELTRQSFNGDSKTWKLWWKKIK